MIDVYGMSSPNVRKVVIMLEELGLAYRFVHVDVYHGEQFRPDFVARSPFSKTPLLVDRDAAGEEQPIFESGAILIYLAEKHARFLPKAGPERYAVISWLMGQMALVGPMLGQLNHFNIRIRDGGDPRENAYAQGRYKMQAERIYRTLDDRLAQAPNLAGGDYSIADIAVYTWSEYLERHGFEAAAFPALERWRAGIRARPAVQRAEAKFVEIQQGDAERRQAATPEDLDRLFWRRPPLTA